MVINKLKSKIALVVALIATAVPVVNSTSATYTPVCITAEFGQGWYWVANQFVPGISGQARDDFIRRIWEYEESARLVAGEQVCVDPNDPAFHPTTTTSTSTSTTSTTTTTVAPTTTTSTSTTTSTTTSTSTTVAPTTTTTEPPSGDVHPVDNIASNFLLYDDDNENGVNESEEFDEPLYWGPREIPDTTGHEPSGNFRTLCQVSHLAYDDPIVYPQQPGASHLHLFFGNTEADGNSTYQSLRTTGDSTCEGGPLNRTGYWMPAMFDGDGQVVPPSLILIYYKSTASGGTLEEMQDDIAATEQLPNGLRMVAGAPGGHIKWMCGDGSSQGTTIPDNCPTGYLIATVDFPDCWDGVNLDSPDHRSHMSYRSYVNGRHLCPESHQVRIPTITENFHWQTGATDVGQWSLSSDMGAPDGSTLHADWFGAWDNSIQDTWFNECLGGRDESGTPNESFLDNLRNSNNGNLCDGRGLSSAQYSGEIPNTDRIPGWSPMQP